MAIPTESPHPYLAQYLAGITVAVGLVGVVARWVICQRKNPPKSFELDVVISAFTQAASIPVGVMLIAASFDNTMLALLSNLNIALAAAGLATLWLAIKGLTS